jgi:CheY-like chemotaxis protein
MGTRILLADDSVTIQKVVELTFMDEDYEVVAVSNGDEAVAQLAGVEPALVIADVHMPGANGYDVCRRVKEWRPGTPVLLLVGTFEPFQEDEAARAGADGHLKKPFDSQELLRRVETMLANAAAAPAPVVVHSPAEEMDLWAPAAPEPVAEEAEVFGGVADDTPDAFSPSQPLPDELVVERDPWTEADERPTESSWAAAAEQPAASAPAFPEPPPMAAAPAAAAAGAVAASGNGAAMADGQLSDGDVDRIARRVAELLGEKLLREVAWEVIPDMAELVIKDRIRELERQLEGT